MGTWTLQITDEKEGDVTDCVDRPWEYGFIDEATGAAQTLTCDTLRDDITDCADQLEPEVAQLEFEGTALLDACCRCGGGYPELPNTLVSWNLVLYGREVALATATTPPTQRPDTTDDQSTPAPTQPSDQVDDQFTIQNADGTTVQIPSNNGTTVGKTNSSLPTVAPVQESTSTPVPMEPTAVPTGANSASTDPGQKRNGAFVLSLATFAAIIFD